MAKLSFTFLLFVFSSFVWADTATCIIEIDDINVGTKYKVEHRFVFKPGSMSQDKVFALPRSNFVCRLVFFDLESGTALSCELDELGHHFVQSDRSIIKEKYAKNSLNFRYKSWFYVLKSECK